jgi:hypothetical protein
MASMKDPAVHGCLCFYSAAIYPIFNRLTRAECQTAVDAALDANMREPCLARNKAGQFSEFDIPHFGRKSGPYCVALMSAWLVWNQKVLADNPLPDSPLLAAAADGLHLWRSDQLAAYWREARNAAAPV